MGKFNASHASAQLREWRRRTGTTQKELAERTGATQAMICQYERNHIRPEVRTCVALYLVTGIPVVDWYPEIIDLVARAAA